LVILGGGEDLGRSDRNSSVSGDEVSHNTSSSLDSNGKGGHVKSNQVLNGLIFSGENGRLDSGTESNTLIRVNVLVQSLSSEDASKDTLDFGDSAGASNK